MEPLSFLCLELSHDRVLFDFSLCLGYVCSCKRSFVKSLIPALLAMPMRMGNTKSRFNPLHNNLGEASKLLCSSCLSKGRLFCLCVITSRLRFWKSRHLLITFRIPARSSPSP